MQRTQAQETYSGVPLMALLVELGVPQKLKGKDFRLYVVAEGRDGNKVVYSLGEISPDIHDGSVLLVDSVDGKPLADNSGPIELICSGERRPARWVQGVSFHQSPVSRLTCGDLQKTSLSIEEQSRTE